MKSSSKKDKDILTVTMSLRVTAAEAKLINKAKKAAKAKNRSVFLRKQILGAIPEGE